MKRNGGFTLIEIIMVTLVIGALTTLGVVTYHGSSAKTRNAQRQKDIHNYQNALELYYTKNGNFPIEDSGWVDISTLCTSGLNMSTQECKTDPSGGNYKYLSDSDGLNYNLWMQPENSTAYYVLCSNGESGFVSAEPATAGCPDF